MSDEHFADTLARRLARPAGRRPVLAALVAGAAAAGIGAGPEAEAHRRRRGKACRTRSDCKVGQACVDRRCQEAPGTAGRHEPCRTTADCSTADGPAACATGTPCAAAKAHAAPAQTVCLGSVDFRGGILATCQRDCECARNLACLDGHCVPRPGSLAHYDACHASADCSTADGPAVCEVGSPCMCAGDPGFPCTDYPRCVGSYDAGTGTGTGARCDGCRCARGLVCENGRCRPAPTS